MYIYLYINVCIYIFMCMHIYYLKKYRKTIKYGVLLKIVFISIYSYYKIIDLPSKTKNSKGNTQALLAIQLSPSVLR